MHGLRTTLLLVCCCTAILASAQPPITEAHDPLFKTLPFDKWVKQGEAKQLKWKLHLHKPELLMQQRLAAVLLIEVPGELYVKRAEPNRVVVLLQVTTADGHVFQDHLTLKQETQRTVNKNADVQFTWGMFLLPGQYRIVAVVADTKTGEHSLAFRTVDAAPLKDDPLPQAWRNLPAVEFFGSGDVLDDAMLPEINGRLNLPLRTRAPLDLELLLNLEPPEVPVRMYGKPANASTAEYVMTLASTLPMLRVLSQIELSNGHMEVAALDTMRRKVNFDQRVDEGVDWEKLRTALKSADPTIIDVASLQDRKQNAPFVRSEVIHRALGTAEHKEAHDGRGSSGGDHKGEAERSPASGEKPLRVVILLGREMHFESRVSVPHEAMLPPDCNCRVYYLYRRGRWSLGGKDDLRKTLEPLGVRDFAIDDARDFRNALAKILAEISAM